MNVIRNISLMSGVLLLFIAGLKAQPVTIDTSMVDTPAVNWEENYPYVRKEYKEKKVMPYEHLREADVYWERVVWRDIFIKEKMNWVFNYPKAPFVNTLLDIVMRGEVQAFEIPIPPENEFDPVRLLTLDQIKRKRYSTDTIPVIDPITGLEIMEVTQTDVISHMKKFRLKEHWIFDKQTSTMIVRLIGIAPYYEELDEDGNFVGDVGLFWIFYPDIRPFLINTEVYNPYNYGGMLTWDDIFELRYFGSYITKVDNMYDREIGGYVGGIQALLESEKVTKEIFEFEYNLWSH